jgi:hypothetical protein
MALLLPAFLFYIINRIDDTVKKAKTKIYLCFVPFAFSAVLTLQTILIVAGIYTIPEPGIVIIEIVYFIFF